MTTEIQLPNEQQVSQLQVVSFRVGEEEYTVDILRVQEIIRIPEMTRVPKTPSFLRGVINLRGQIIPVMELRNRLGMQSIPDTKETRIVVVEDSEKTVGLIVDAMSEVLRIPETALQPVPVTSQLQSQAEYIQGVAKLKDRLLILLNLETLLGETIM